jgi:hypothetical protein
MSQENVETCNRCVDSFNRRDLEANLKELHPEMTGRAVLLAMVGSEETVYRGHGGVRELWRELGEAFAEFQIEISEIDDPGERVVAIGHFHGRGKASGAEVEAGFADEPAQTRRRIMPPPKREEREVPMRQRLRPRPVTTSFRPWDERLA